MKIFTFLFYSDILHCSSQVNLLLHTGLCIFPACAILDCSVHFTCVPFTTAVVSCFATCLPCSSQVNPLLHIGYSIFYALALNANAQNKIEKYSFYDYCFSSLLFVTLRVVALLGLKKNDLYKSLENQ